MTMAMMTTIPEAGFTQSLITYLQQSQNELSKIIDQQKIQAESSCRALDEIQSREGDLLHQQIQQLEQIQIQRGILLQPSKQQHQQERMIVPIVDADSSTTSSIQNTDGMNTIASQMALVKEKQRHLEQELTQAHVSLTQTQTLFDGKGLHIYVFL